ncbi:metallophosphoesterase [Candidatus Pacearchaeota archaeon]|nr:metallophosphoesterase [Candidatus Pacearchaeota archaeon]
MNPEILKIIREEGLLLEKEIFDILDNFPDVNLARDFLLNIEKISGQKIITKSLLNKNFEYVKAIISKFPGENKELVEKVFVKLGFMIEIKKESLIIDKKEEEKKILNAPNYQIFYSTVKNDKKIKVEDFVGNFRSRYHQLQRILMQRQELQNLVAINKIGNERKSYSIIGIVKEKRKSKNNNFIIKMEDLTGEIAVLVKVDKFGVFEKADELLLDEVIGIRASGDREMLFVHDIIFPDAFIYEKVKFNEDIAIGFLSDIHAGGMKHLQKSFENFLEWINSEDEYAKKIKYLFIAGDNVDGVGVFPGQEHLLKLKSLKEQYRLLAFYLKKIPKQITIFMCPGQHDAVRLAEPQPVIGRKYGEALYDIENLVLVSNPAMIKILEGNKEFKIMMYHGDSIHSFIHGIKELRETKAHKTPARAVKHMLKRRHLFPIHGEAVYIPDINKDNLVISEIPDLFCTGEVHKVDVENYNNILIITGSCWQGMTSHEEKVGNIPDPCKVPIFNLKTRELKILDFGVEEELKELHIR